jgi:N-acetylglutamate synthase-like GNAT family acetyltransferase
MIVDEMEQKLRPPEIEMQPYPPKVTTLANGQEMVVREASRDEVHLLLESVHPLISVPHDFYDLVAVRMYAELLGWYRYRVANEFVIVAAIDGEIAGIVNSRMVDEKVGMSLHTLAIKRGLRIGAQLFASKMEHHLDYLGQDEVWIVAEGPIGFRRWMLEYGLESREHLYPEVHHELGGVPTYVLTKELYDEVRDEKVSGRRPVDPDVLATAEKLKPPEEYDQIPGYKRSKQK